MAWRSWTAVEREMPTPFLFSGALPRCHSLRQQDPSTNPLALPAHRGSLPHASAEELAHSWSPCQQKQLQLRWSSWVLFSLWGKLASSQLHQFLQVHMQQTANATHCLPRVQAVTTRFLRVHMEQTTSATHRLPRVQAVTTPCKSCDFSDRNVVLSATGRAIGSNSKGVCWAQSSCCANRIDAWVHLCRPVAIGLRGQATIDSQRRVPR